MSDTNKRYLLTLPQELYDDAEAEAKATKLPGGRQMSVADYTRQALMEKVARDKQARGDSDPWSP